MRIQLELELSFNKWLKLMRVLKESNIELVHVYVEKNVEDIKNDSSMV